MDVDVLTIRAVDGIAVITLGSARRIYIDQQTSDALFEALNKCAGDADIRVVVVTGAAPGSFVRHYSIPELIRFAESVRATGREWPEARSLRACAPANPSRVTGCPGRQFRCSQEYES